MDKEPSDRLDRLEYVVKKHLGEAKKEKDLEKGRRRVGPSDLDIGEAEFIRLLKDFPR